MMILVILNIASAARLALSRSGSLRRFISIFGVTCRKAKFIRQPAARQLLAAFTQAVIKMIDLVLIDGLDHHRNGLRKGESRAAIVTVEPLALDLKRAARDLAIRPGH